MKRALLFQFLAIFCCTLCTAQTTLTRSTKWEFDEDSVGSFALSFNRATLKKQIMQLVHADDTAELIKVGTIKRRQTSLLLISRERMTGRKSIKTDTAVDFHWAWYANRLINNSFDFTKRRIGSAPSFDNVTLHDTTLSIIDTKGHKYPIDWLRQENFVSATNSPHFEPAAPTPYNDRIEKESGYDRADIIREFDNYAFRKRKKPFVYIGASFGLYSAYRILSVHAVQLHDNAGLEHRQQNELTVVGQSFGITVGLRLTPSHSITLEPFYLKQGFRCDDGLNWETGLPTATTGPKNDHQVKYLGFGVGYSYAPYHHVVSPVVDLGVYAASLSQWEDGQRPFTWGVKGGWGITVRPGYSFEFRFVPTVYCSLHAISKGELKTQLINAGLNAGIVYRFMRKEYSRQ